MRQLALALVAAFIASACGGTAAPSPSPSPSVGATVAASPTVAKATCQPTSVKIAVPVTPPNVVHLPPYVAQELGYFKDENLTVELVRFEGGVGALKAMVAGGVNLAGTSTEPVVNAISQGVEVKVIGSYAPNISQVFAVRGDIVKAPADLKGNGSGSRRRVPSRMRSRAPTSKRSGSTRTMFNSCGPRPRAALKSSATRRAASIRRSSTSTRSSP